MIAPMTMNRIRNMAQTTSSEEVMVESAPIGYSLVLSMSVV